MRLNRLINIEQPLFEGELLLSLKNHTSDDQLIACMLFLVTIFRKGISLEDKLKALRLLLHIVMAKLH